MQYYSDNLLSIVHKVLKENPTLLSIIRERKYKIADTGMTYRQLNVLDGVGLIDESRKSEKEWRTFNLNDILYLHLIRNLKGFGTRNDRIGYIQKLFYSKRLNLRGSGPKDTISISFSEIGLIGLLLQQVPIGILVFSDGDAVITDKPDIFFLDGYLDIKERSYLFIMLYETFRNEVVKFLEKENIQNKYDLEKYQDLYVAYPISPRDRKLLEFVKNNTYSKIVIEKKENGKFIIKGESISRNAKITPEDLMSMIYDKKYGDIRIHKENKGIDFIEEIDVDRV